MELMKKGQQVVFCKNCGSNKIKITPHPYIGGLLALGLALFFVGAWIPFFGWFIMLPLGLILFAISLILPFIVQTMTVSCNSCSHRSKISKKKYRIYKKAIK